MTIFNHFRDKPARALKLRADMLRFYGEELNYSDLLVGFAMIGLATWMSENLVEKIAGDLNILDVFDQARKGDKSVQQP